MLKRTLPLHCLYREDTLGEILIDSNILRSMIRQLSRNRQTEEGGFLGIDSRGIISDFQYDWSAQRDATGYIPNSACLADAMRKWQTKGLSFCGIVHTHSTLQKLSYGDLVYTQKLLVCNPNIEKLIMGLLVDGKLQMYLFGQDFVPWLNHKLQHNKPLYHSHI